MSNISCEPILELPQKFDIGVLRKERAVYNKKNKAASKHPKKDLDLNGGDHAYNVLPVQSYQNEKLKVLLSVTRNAYMHCRWNKFLDNPPDKWVHVTLYANITKKPEPVRRMQLNGKFYVKNKLAPIPYVRDPRLIESYASSHANINTMG